MWAAITCIAASMLNRTDADEAELAQLAAKAIAIARVAGERSGEAVPSGPMARTAEKTAIGILAAGILNTHAASLRKVSC